MTILDLPMEANDSGATTVRGYLKELLCTLFKEGECFSGKRPFGNSGWQYDLYRPIIKAGFAKGRIDEDGCVDGCDSKECDRLIYEAIAAM